MKRKTRSWLRFVLLLLLVGGVYLVMRNFEQEFVYAPSPFINKTPRDAGMSFDNIVLVADDGVNIQGWYIPAQPPDQPPATNAPPATTLLFLHGRAGNMGDSLEKVHLFHDMGLNVFIIDYHGYGKSGGTPSERALTGDALIAYFYLSEKHHVTSDRLYLYGQDLGGAVAIDLATKVFADGLITEGANASVIEKIQDAWPLIPWEFLLRNQFDALAKIGNVHIPVLLIHSVEDDVVPINDSRRLFSLANDPKEMVEIHGTQHDAFFNSFDIYYDKISHFVSGPANGKPAEGSSSTQTNEPASKMPNP
jgi:uncharacterized protein